MNRWLTLLPALLWCVSGKAQVQVVTPNPSQMSVTPGTEFAVDVNYTTQPLQPNTTGLTLRLHYNSSQMSYVGLPRYLGKGLLANLPVTQADTTNLDNDPATDRYLLMSWLSASVDWPGSLPVRLYRVSFAASPTFRGATLRFSAEGANGYTVTTTPIVLTAPPPGILVQPTAGLSTSEAGVSDSFSVVLAAPPSAAVTIGLRSSDLSEGTVQPTSLQFDASNWQTARTVTVTGVDDAIIDGNISYTIVTDPATSTDLAYNGMDAANVSAINQDNEAANPPTLSVPLGLTARPGTSLVVPVQLTGLSGANYTSFDFRLSFNPSLLQFVALVTQGTTSAGWTVIPNSSQPGLLRIGGISASAIAEGMLIGIQFSVPTSAPDGACSDLVLQDALFDSTLALLQSGRCCTVSCIKGDGNGDNLVQAYDGALALRKAIGLPTPFDPIPLACLDADCNGTLLAEDGALILRHALGLIGQFCATPATFPRQAPISVSMTAQQRVSGERFEIPIQVSPVISTDGIYSYQFALDYDPTLLAMEGIALEDTLSTGWTVQVNDTQPGRIIIGAMSASALAGEGVLLRLRARALEAEGTLTMNWQQFVFGAGQPHAATVDTQVQIEENQAPTGMPFSLLVEQGMASRPVWPGIEDANASDHHQLDVLTEPTQGTVQLGEEGFVYQSGTNFVGEDHFRYRITDAGGLSDEVEAKVLVLGAQFFETMGAWPLGDIKPLIAGINDPHSTVGAKRPPSRPGAAANSDLVEQDLSWHEIESRMEQAWQWVDQGHEQAARTAFERMALSKDPEQAWLAQSALVALERSMNHAEGAYAQTARIAKTRPELAPLMLLWDGDTAMINGEVDLALALYEDLLEGHAHDYVDGVSLGSRALKQIARAQIAAERPAEAAAALRSLLRQHGYEVNHEFTLAQALLFENMAAGVLPLAPLEELSQKTACAKPCLVMAEDGLGEPVSLANLQDFQFVLGPGDIADLEAAALSQRRVDQTLVVCTVTAATTGFQVPLDDTRQTGYRFMQLNDSGQYHPGLDINAGTSGSADCDMPFKAVAAGCVRDSSPSNWGSAVIHHAYTPEDWYSQYGHASTIYFSADAAITKGAKLGLVGKVGATECHLHHELRESDHPDPTNADYYSSLQSKANVGDWYDDPTSFVRAHRSYKRVYWRDEQDFSTQGTWTSKTGVGHRDDLLYAATTQSSNKANVATRSFSPSASALHELWIFVPYNYGDSKKVTYRFLNGTTEVMKLTVDQSVHLDAWVRIGSANLIANTQYVLEVASNTGETGLRVALDDVLLIQP